MSQKYDEGDVLKNLFSVIGNLIKIMVLLIVIIIALPLGYYLINLPEKPKVKLEDSTAVIVEVKSVVQEFWIAPDVNTIADAQQKAEVEYGRNLLLIQQST
jgi:hypothetical protein